jgi:hypothetical protein
MLTPPSLTGTPERLGKYWITWTKVNYINATADVKWILAFSFYHSHIYVIVIAIS